MKVLTTQQQLPARQQLPLGSCQHMLSRSALFHHLHCYRSAAPLIGPI